MNSKDAFMVINNVMLIFCFVIYYDLLSIKGKLKFESENLSGAETPKMGVSVNSPKNINTSCQKLVLFE